MSWAGQGAAFPLCAYLLREELRSSYVPNGLALSGLLPDSRQVLRQTRLRPFGGLAVRREHPGFGVRRIAQWLRRTLLLPGSAETVRRSLRRAQPGPPRARPIGWGQG
jgi:hypothetical protein